MTHPDQLIKEDTPNQLVLAPLHKFRVWGGISLILALVSVLGTMATDLYLSGGIVALFYVSAGVWLITSNRSITFDISQQVVSFSTHHLLFSAPTIRGPARRIT
jgi:hypothetical protein